jgi:hypothetical protein
VEKTDILHQTLNAHLEFAIADLNLKAEYAHSELGSQQEVSWYLKAAYSFGKLTPYISYLELDPNLDIEDDSLSISLIGLNFRVTDNLVYKIEWNEFHRQSQNISIQAGESANYGEFRTAIAIHF